MTGIEPRWRSRAWRFLVLLALGLVLTLTGGRGFGEGGRISISLEDVELRKVMNMLSRQERVNILVSEGVEARISVNLFDVDIEQAVRSIAAAAGYAVEHRDGSFFIVDRDQAGKHAEGGLTELRTFKVQYTTPEIVEAILKKHLSSYGKITKLGERDLLVVEDLPHFLDRIESLLAEIDLEPKQILIEARILEITLNDSESFGLDWARLFSRDNGEGAFGVRGLSNPTSDGFFFELVTPNIRVFLDTLRERGRMRTLSTPKLLAIEGQESMVMIGEDTGYRVTTTINQVTSETIEFLQSGIILRVVAAVDQHGRILLNVHPEVSTARVSDDGIPSKRAIQVTTQMLMPDGETAFIGGLITQTVNETREGMPVLGDIPGVGRIFSNKGTAILRTETVVLITPKVIGEATARWVKEPVIGVDRIQDKLQQRTAPLSPAMDQLMQPEIDRIMGRDKPAAGQSKQEVREAPQPQLQSQWRPAPTAVRTKQQVWTNEFDF